ncbi:MAG: serine/threonine protein kinase [Anaerolineae bacterium]|nr:serine/threonine protein kinase [Gemmatimonadaceae bacterium]
MPTVTAAVPTTATVDLIRSRLGDRYTLDRELGRGGMGTVYLARDLRLDRAVALKVLPPEFATQTALRERFLLETRTAAKFSHPNIVPVYAVEETEDLLAYTMGLVEGETLTDRVQRVGPLTVREIVRLLQDVGYALAYAHGRGVVHRDIKPDNIMLERATGRALVMDFGISRSIMPARTGSTLTRVGEVVGTPEYMSPEQASGDHVDGRSDLYALGLTAHFAATGRMTMTADTTQKILVKQLTELVPPISQSRNDLPPALSEAIDRCVQKDPEHRFATAEELVEAIDAGQLAEPEIPLPIRLFAGEAGTLSMVAIGILLLSLYMIESGLDNDLAGLDIILPVVGLMAVLLTRVLTTLSEARRLAIAGFSVDEVMAGLSRVVAERARRREELRADAAVRRRRRNTLVWALAMLGMAAPMIWAAFQMRVRVGPTSYQVSVPGIVLVTSGVALIGIGTVLLIKSPFRMPVGERFFRLAWLGPLGRLFVRFAGRRVRTSSTGAGVRLPSAPAMASVSGVKRSATTSAPAPQPGDRIGALETRVAELERWREQR